MTVEGASTDLPLRLSVLEPSGALSSTTDYPALDLAQSVETLEATRFQNPNALPRIFRDNAARLLGLD